MSTLNTSLSNRYFNATGFRKNQCVQMDTSVYSMQLHSIDIAQDTEPQFMEDDDEPLNYFRASDPFYYNDYDPYTQDVDDFENGARSQEAADSLNPLT